jgi:TPR repeat protein
MSIFDPWRAPQRPSTLAGPGIALLALLAAVGFVVLQQTAWPQSSLARAGTLRQAEAAFRHGNYQPAADIFTALADKNNAAAEYWLGHMNELGLGMPRDVTRALKLYKQAASQNVRAANLRLGEVYLHGNLVPPDFTKAKTYLTDAADGGDARAAMLLGEMYRRGLGRAADPKKAYAWLEVSAIEGNSEARHMRDQSLNSLDPSSQRAAATLADNILGSINHGAAKSESASPSASSA